MTTFKGIEEDSQCERVKAPVFQGGLIPSPAQRTFSLVNDGQVVTNPPVVYATFIVYNICEGPEILDLWPDEVVGWIEDEDHSWEDLLDAPSMPRDTNWVRWMLEQGIAPGQAFTVRVERPEYHRDYWGEYDVDYGATEVVRREPLDELQASILWMGAWGDSRVSDLVSVSMEEGLTWFGSDLRTEGP